MGKFLHQSVVLALSAVFLAAGCSTTETGQLRGKAPDTGAQIFTGMGTYGRSITTTSPEAQKHFNQGLNWMYAFNHDEAVRSFKQAAVFDPNCAMAWWGVSICHGPNYNDPMMTPQRNADAWAALQKAQARIKNTSPVERALIEALTHRYANPAPEDRGHLDQAYADAMERVYERYPFDADVATLYAESMMDLRPWRLYSIDYVPAPDTPQIERLLERAMALAPNSPGPYHLYIHAVEPSASPQRGLEASARLSDLMPASGHLMHMPSHIYVKTGHWERAIEQNEKSLVSDIQYRSLTAGQTVQYFYQVHNAHMLAFAAMMSGQETKAMKAARDMWAMLPEQALREIGPMFDLWMCSLWDVQKRFGRWDDLLAEPGPPEYLPITTAVWHAQRAIAYAAKKDFDSARAEQALFTNCVDALSDDHMSGFDPSHRILAVSEYFIDAEIELQQGHWDKAAELLEEGARVEDVLTYGEPPQWLQPIRHTLGAVYMAGGDYASAERVYRDDLVKWPNNGWSLYGLMRALENQAKYDDAADVRRRYEAAWSKADAPIRTSCYCIPRL